MANCDSAGAATVCAFFTPKPKNSKTTPQSESNKQKGNNSNIMNPFSFPGAAPAVVEVDNNRDENHYERRRSLSVESPSHNTKNNTEIVLHNPFGVRQRRPLTNVQQQNNYSEGMMYSSYNSSKVTTLATTVSGASPTGWVDVQCKINGQCNIEALKEQVEQKLCSEFGGDIVKQDTTCTITRDDNNNQKATISVHFVSAILVQKVLCQNVLYLPNGTVLRIGECQHIPMESSTTSMYRGPQISQQQHPLMQLFPTGVSAPTTTTAASTNTTKIQYTRIPTRSSVAYAPDRSFCERLCMFLLSVQDFQDCDDDDASNDTLNPPTIARMQPW